MNFIPILVLMALVFFPCLSQAEKGVAVPVFSAEASADVRGAVSDGAAATVAVARAELQALSDSMRFLARLPYVQLAGANDGSASFLPTLLDGLAWEIFAFEHQTLRDGQDSDTPAATMQARVVATFTGQDIHAAITEALGKRAILERYSAALHLQEEGLQRVEPLLALLYKAGHASGARQTREELRSEVQNLRALSLYRSELPNYAGLWADPPAQRAVLQQALEKSPDNPLLLGAMAEIALQENRVDEAQQRIALALQAEKRFAFLHDVQGLVYLRQQLPLLASRAFAAAISQAPREPQYRLHRASALLLMGEQESMCADFREACVQGDCTGILWARGQGYCLGSGHGQATGKLPEEPPAGEGLAGVEVKGPPDIPFISPRTFRAPATPKKEGGQPVAKPANTDGDRP